MSRPKQNPLREGKSSKIFLIAYNGDYNIYRIEQILLGGWNYYKEPKDRGYVEDIVKNNKSLFKINEKDGKKSPKSKVEPIILEIEKKYSLKRIVKEDLIDLLDCEDFRKYILNKVKKYPIINIEKDAFLEIMFYAGIFSDPSNYIRYKVIKNMHIPNNNKILDYVKKLPSNTLKQVVKEILELTINENPDLLHMKNKDQMFRNIENEVIDYFKNPSKEKKELHERDLRLINQVRNYDDETIRILHNYYLKISTMIENERLDDL